MLSLNEIGKKMSELKNWSLNGEAIIKDFSFSNFKDAIEFVNKVSELAENKKHYPGIIVNKNLVRLKLSPVEFKEGLTYDDFNFGKEIDLIK